MSTQVASWLAQGRNHLQAGDFEAMDALLGEIQTHQVALSAAELIELRDQVGLWIEAVVAARAASALALRDLRGGQHALQAYASVASAG